jgi:hypothetical protein
MIPKKNLRKASGLSIILMLVFIAVSASCTATQQSQTILDITELTGGLGKVSVSVKNIGDSTAETITISISVKGGLFNRINIEKTCSGCDACGTTLEPNAIKTESTSESGFIVGFGPVTIIASAEAENAEKVEKTYNGFVLGPYVIVTE